MEERINQLETLTALQDDTIAELHIDGIQQPAGNYDSSESWLSGSGTLTGLNSAGFLLVGVGFDLLHFEIHGSYRPGLGS